MVGLGAAAGEDDPVGRDVQALGEPAARALRAARAHGGPAPCSEDGIAGSAMRLGHRRHHLRPHRGGGGVIEIDRRGGCRVAGASPQGRPATARTGSRSAARSASPSRSSSSRTRSASRSRLRVTGSSAMLPGRGAVGREAERLVGHRLRADRPGRDADHGDARPAPPCTTTALEPMRAPSPTVNGPSTAAPAPTTTPLPSVGMALAGIEADAAQGDALIERHVVADLGGLADHHAHAVVDEEAAADHGTGVDLDAGHEAADLRDEAAGELPAAPPEPVRRAGGTSAHGCRGSTAPPRAATAPPDRAGRPPRHPRGDS